MRFEDIKNYGVNFTDNTDFKQFGVSDDANKKFLVFEEFKKYLEEQGIELDDKQIMGILNSNVATENLTDVFNKILNFGNTVKNDAETPAITEPLPEAEQLPAEKTITDEQNGGFDNEDLLEGYDTKIEAQDNKTNDDDWCYDSSFQHDIRNLFNAEVMTDEKKLEFIAEQKAKNKYLYEGKTENTLRSWYNLPEDEKAKLLEEEKNALLDYTSKGIDELFIEERARCIAEHRALNEFMYGGTEVKDFQDWLKLDKTTRENKIGNYKSDLKNFEGSLEDYIWEIDAATARATAFSELREKLSERERNQAKSDLLADRLYKNVTEHYNQPDNIVNNMLHNPDDENWAYAGVTDRQKRFLIDYNVQANAEIFVELNNKVREKFKSLGYDDKVIDDILAKMYSNPNDENWSYAGIKKDQINELLEYNKIYKTNGKSVDNTSDLIKSYYANTNNTDPTSKQRKEFLKHNPINVGSKMGETSTAERAYLATLNETEKAEYESKTRTEQSEQIKKWIKSGKWTNKQIHDFITSTWETLDLEMQDTIYNALPEEMLKNLASTKNNQSISTANIIHINNFDPNTSGTATVNAIAAFDGNNEAQNNIAKMVAQFRDKEHVTPTQEALVNNAEVFDLETINMATQDANNKVKEEDAEKLAEIHNRNQKFRNASARYAYLGQSPKTQKTLYQTAVTGNAEAAQAATEAGTLEKLDASIQAECYETTHNAFESGMSPEEAREWNSKLYNQVSTLSPEAQHTIASNPEYAQEFTNYTANAVARDRELQGLISIQPYAAIPKTDKEIFREHWEAMTPTERYNFICNISLKNFSKLSPALRKRILEHAKNDPVFMKNLVKRYGLDLLKNQLFPDALSIIVRELFNDPSERVKVAREVCNDSNRYPASLVEDCQLILAEHYGIDESSFEQLSGMEKRQALQDPNRTDLTSIGAQSGTNRNNLPDYSNDYFKKKSNLNGLV